MTTLLEHSVAQPTEYRFFFSKNNWCGSNSFLCKLQWLEWVGSKIWFYMPIKISLIMNFISVKNITLIGEQLFSYLKVNSSPIKKLFDQNKYFSKNLYSVGCTTLFSKSLVMLRMLLVPKLCNQVPSLTQCPFWGIFVQKLFSSKNQ